MSIKCYFYCTLVVCYRGSLSCKIGLGWGHSNIFITVKNEAFGIIRLYQVHSKCNGVRQIVLILSKIVELIRWLDSNNGSKITAYNQNNRVKNGSHRSNLV